MQLVFYSRFGNVKKFIQKLNQNAFQINDLPLTVNSGYILITPTYREKNGSYVPYLVNEFLKLEKNWFFLRGIIASGDSNFISTFCKAGYVLSQRYKVPLYHTFEGPGNEKDIERVKEILNT